MWMPVVIRSDGSAEFIAADIAKLSARSQDMTEPLTAVIRRIVAGVGKQFATEGARAGFPWRELAPKYAAWKESKVPGLPMLVGVRRTATGYDRSGEMFAQATTLAATEVTPRRAVYAPTSETLGLHQFGTGQMPARPPVLFSLSEELAWPRIFLEWIDQQIIEAGL